MLNATFPLLTAADSLFASLLPAWARILLWGAVAGALAMLIYRLASDQVAIARLKALTRNLRRRMLDPELEQPEVGRLVRENLKASFKLLGRTLLPGLLSALPVLLIAVWMDTFYGYAAPAGGEPVRLRTEPQEVSVAVEPAGLLARGGADPAVLPPAAGDRLTLVAAGVTAYVGNPFSPPAPAITKRRWWNTLLASEVGYLDPQAGIDEIAFDLPRRRLVGGLPDWIAGWEMPYFLSILVVAAGLKFGLKIE